MRHAGHTDSQRAAGFTLIEVMVTLVLMATLAVLSYRSLDTVLTARDRVTAETQKWQQLDAFISRFKQDVQLAGPYSVRRGDTVLPAWHGRTDNDSSVPLLEFSRFASIPGQDRLRRVAYTLNDNGEFELWIWPGLNLPPATDPARYVVLDGVTAAVFEYLNADLSWVPTWPVLPSDAAIPRAVRLQLELDSGEILVRIFALST